MSTDSAADVRLQPTEGLIDEQLIQALDFPHDRELSDLEPHSRTPETFRERFRRKFGRIPRTVFACCIMLLGGIILVILPSIVTVTASARIGLYITGSLLLIPGIYVGYILYHVFRDTPGFTLDGLPLWDELV